MKVLPFLLAVIIIAIIMGKWALVTVLVVICIFYALTSDYHVK